MRSSWCSLRRRCIGLGTLGGFKLQVEDRADAGPQALFTPLSDALGKANTNPALGGAFSTYQINVPQLNIDVDRVKVKRQNVKLSDVFEHAAGVPGLTYVNDFNRFGRTYQVVAQADAPFRAQLDDIMPLKTRNASGDMVPLGSLLNVSRSFGPDVVQRYNAYTVGGYQWRPCAGLQLRAGAGGDVQDPRGDLPRGMSYEWTDLAYQQLISGNTATSSSRCACCSCSWCWPRSTRA